MAGAGAISPMFAQGLVFDAGGVVGVVAGGVVLDPPPLEPPHEQHSTAMAEAHRSARMSFMSGLRFRPVYRVKNARASRHTPDARESKLE
jgi:hypothetical protein